MKIQALAFAIVLSSFFVFALSYSPFRAFADLQPSTSSATLGEDNAYASATPIVNDAINLPGPATLLPATSTPPGSDFYFVQCFRTDDAASFSSSAAENLLSNSTSVGGTGASDRLLSWNTFSKQATAGTLSISIRASSNNWWLGTTPTSISIRPNQVGCLVGGQIGTKQFLASDDSNGNPFPGSPMVSTTSNMGSTSFWKNGGTFRGQSAIGSIFNEIGGATQLAAWRRGWGGSVGDFAFFWGTFPNTNGVPDTSTVAAIANGSKAFSTLPGTCRYHLPMGDAASGTAVADPNCAITTSATTTGAILSGSPVRISSSIRLDERGDGYVFRATPGTTGPNATGTIYITGTYVDNGQGAPTAVDARIEDINGKAITSCTGSCDWQTIATSPTGGTFSGQITGVRVGGPYYVAVRYDNIPSVEYHSRERTYVGLVIVTDGQSQENVLWSPVAGSGADSIPLAASTTASVLFVQNLRDSAPPTNTPYGYPALRVLTPASMAGSDANYIGDGMTSFVNTLSSLSGGWPIMVANVAKSGTPIDASSFDRTVATQTLTGSGTTWSGTLAYTPPAPAHNITTFAVLAGSVNVYVNGTLVAIDSNTPGNTGTIVAQGGSGVSGTIDYRGHAISLTFPSTPAAAPVVQWKLSADGVSGNFVLNNPLTGFTVFGDGTPTSGMASYVWSRINAPVSAVTWLQATANESEFTAPSVWAGGEASYLAKLNLLKQQFASLSNYDSSTPFVIDTHSRVSEGNNSTEYYKVEGIRKAQYDISAPGNSNGYVFGGTYTDLSLISDFGPHEDNSAAGTARAGRRMAYGVWGAQSGDTTLVRGPEATSASFVSGSNNSQIDVSFALFGGTSLTTGSGTTTMLKDFRVGTSTLYFDDGLEPITQRMYPNQAFTASLIGTSTVRLTKLSGSWNATTTTVDYEFGHPFVRIGTALSMTAVPGSGYTNGGPYAVTFTGGACTTEPTGLVSVSGGQLVQPVLTNTGTSCTSTPTGSIAAGAGSGTGSVSLVMGTTTSDTADLSTLLYDNRGIIGGNEPGMPALPIYSPLTVSAAGTSTDTTAPSVTLIAPTASSTVSSTTPLTANASDNVAVANVGFLIDGNLVQTVTGFTSPYTYMWDSTSVANGTHTVTAVAEDTSGNYATTSPLTFTVNQTTGTSTDTVPPSVTLVAPTASSTVSGSVSLTANASDNVAVANVGFLIDGTTVQTITGSSSPYSYAWDNSTSVADGTHNVTAVAEDTSGNYATTTPVSFTVSNATSTQSSPAEVHLTFDQSTISGSTATDSSGNGFNATLVNSPTTTPGEFNEGLALDGSTQGAKLGTTATLSAMGITNNLTISAWVKPSNLTSPTQAAVAKAATGSSAATEVATLYLMRLSTRPSVDFSDGTNLLRVVATSGPTISTNTWYHIVGTLSGQTASIYVNGALVGTTTSSSFGTIHDLTSYPWAVGYDARSNRNYLAGTVDDVRIYARALTASEVAQLYANTLP